MMRLTGAVVLAVFLTVTFMLPTGSKGAARRLSSVAVPEALAGDFSSGGMADRQLMGLFSESIGGNFKPKVPSSQWGYVRNVRLFAIWRIIEVQGKGIFDWSGLDAEINNALSLGVDSILLTITGPVPPWAENPANASPIYQGPPARMQDWGDFCEAVAGRYRNYVDFYQIWNEPGCDVPSEANHPGILHYTSSCEYTYLGMLRAGYKAVKKWGQNLQVISGAMLKGLTRSGSDFTYYETLLSGANQDVSMKVTAGKDIVAERPMYFDYHGSWKDGSVEQGVKQPAAVWYLAEGATHPGFEEWICIQNPGATQANVSITYMFPGGRTQEQNLSVGPNTRATVDVNAAVGPDKNVSARVTGSQPIVVERPMYFNYHGSWDGGSISAGVTELSKTWYLAEGATQPGFEEWISLMNPGAAAANVKITYMFPGGATQEQYISMPPTSRETIMVNEVVGANKDVSAKIESTEPIIAERPMYFLYHGAWTGGHTQVGSTATNTSWFLSEGTTRNNAQDGAFEEWISIQNPGDVPADVNFTYMFPGGATQPGTLSVPPHARQTVLVNNVVGPDKDVSVQMNSSQPIVVERPMYFRYHNKMDGGHVELGCTGAGKEWYFAEGTTRSGFEEWTTLQNPNPEATQATITYMFSDGTTQDQTVDLPPNSRTTVGVNRALSMANICDQLSIHPYDYPDYWAWYYQNLRNIQASKGFADKELVVTEIGWPHSGRDEFSPEGQREGIGEKGVGSLWGVGCRKIWIFEDIDPATSWDDAFNGLFYHNGSETPAWPEYKHWQSVLPDYPDKPNHLW